MIYKDYINKTLVPKSTENITVLDLFAGCGGLSLGFEAAGFDTIGYEMDPNAAETYRQNLNGNCLKVAYSNIAYQILLILGKL